MANKCPIGVGDWVRFMQSGRLVIGRVEYTVVYPYDSSKWTITTDCGSVCSDSILEQRPSSPAAEEK